MKEKKQKKKQPTTSKKSSHNTLDWVEKQLRDVRAFDMGITENQNLSIKPINKPSKTINHQIDKLD